MAKRVLVTGASRGIGRAIALALAERGYAVSLNFRSREKDAKETCEKIEQSGGKGILLPFDVADRAESFEVLSRDLKERGAYYGIVCNAGIHSDAPFPAMSEESWDRVLETNLGGFYNVLRPLVMPMVRAKEGGRIVTIASASGMQGNRGQVNYSASKSGLIGATRSLALELAKRKITVNSVAPGLIETEMLEGLPLNELSKLIPMQRLGTPEEVSGVVEFLFSDASSYVTGQVISVNGGLG